MRVNGDVLNLINKKIATIKLELNSLNLAKNELLKEPSKIKYKKYRVRNKNSIAAMSLAVIQHLKTPVHISKIEKELRKKGKNSSNATIAGALNRMIGSELLKVKPGTYTLNTK